MRRLPLLVVPVFLTVALACSGFVPAEAPTEAAPEAEPAPEAPKGPTPNVLFIVADDLGTDKVSVYGEHPDAPPTPRIDALAAEGLLFRNAYAYSVCSPTRAAMLTGRYGRRYGLGGIVSVPEETHELPLSEVLLPEMLQLAPEVWHSAAIGKWHLSGHQTQSSFSHPNDQGFGHFEGTLGNLGTLTDARDGSYQRWEKVTNGAKEVATTYATSATTDDAIRQLGQLSSPFFLYVAYHAPHQPLHVPPEALLPEPLPRRSGPKERYAAVVTALDHEIGRLLDAMSPAQRAQTMVVFLGDNGTEGSAILPPLDPDHGKGTMFEGGTNVPFVVRGPGVPAGQETDALLHVVDLFPTVAELAGVDLSRLTRDGRLIDIDGVSQVPTFRGGEGVRSFVYTEKFRPVGPGPYDADWRAVRDDRYKLLDLGRREPGFFDLQGRFDDGEPLRRAQLTPDEAARYEVLKGQLDLHRQRLGYEH